MLLEDHRGFKKQRDLAGVMAALQRSIQHPRMCIIICVSIILLLVLFSQEIPAEHIDPAAIDLTPLVNTLINSSQSGSRQLFSLLSVTSYSSLALHKLTLLVYNISSIRSIESNMFRRRFCYCVTNETNDLTVSQRNNSDCIYICVMAGKMEWHQLPTNVSHISPSGMSSMLSSRVHSTAHVSPTAMDEAAATTATITAAQPPATAQQTTSVMPQSQTTAEKPTTTILQLTTTSMRPATTVSVSSAAAPTAVTTTKSVMFSAAFSLTQHTVHPTRPSPVGPTVGPTVTERVTRPRLSLEKTRGDGRVHLRQRDDRRRSQAAALRPRALQVLLPVPLQTLQPQDTHEQVFTPAIDGVLHYTDVRKPEPAGGQRNTVTTATYGMKNIRLRCVGGSGESPSPEPLPVCNMTLDKHLYHGPPHTCPTQCPTISAPVIKPTSPLLHRPTDPAPAAPPAGNQ
ncbi:hypothetical protein PAMP_005340 [Pampus punctatissimus]